MSEIVEVKRMNLIRANHVSEKRLDQFLNNNDTLDKEGLLSKGYVVEINDTIEGCFIMEPIQEGLYWLKQLYITQSEAGSLPMLLESILALAKRQHARKVYVHSHQPMVDIILEAMQFHPQQENVLVDKLQEKQGKWWTYNVS